MLVSDLRRIGDNIYRIRKAKGMSRAEVAEHAELSERTYADMERGTVNMRTETVLKVCMALGVTPDDIFVVDEDSSEKELEATVTRLSSCSPKEIKTAIKILDAYLTSINK